MKDWPRLSVIGHSVVFTRDKADGIQSLLDCICIYRGVGTATATTAMAVPLFQLYACIIAR